MKIYLSTQDVLQLSKAIKGGCLDTDKVECLQKLVKGYNPPQEVKDSELDYYLECIKRGWRLAPSKDENEWILWLLDSLPNELVERHKESIINGSLYKHLIKKTFVGLVALKAMGWSIDFSECPNFDWLGEPIPIFN